MKITLNKIKKLEPDEDRLNNFIKHYPNFSGSLKQFIELENISYIDKMFVVTNLFTKEQNMKYLQLCVESMAYDKKLKDAVSVLSRPSDPSRSMSVDELAALVIIKSVIIIGKLEKKQEELNLKLMLECL